MHPKNQPGRRKVSLAPHHPIPPAGLTVNGQIIGEKGGNSDSKTRKTYFGKLGIANAHMDFQMEVTPEKITLWNGAAQSTFSWLDTVTITQDGYSPALGSRRSKELLRDLDKSQDRRPTEVTGETGGLRVQPLPREG